LYASCDQGFRRLYRAPLAATIAATWLSLARSAAAPAVLLSDAQAPLLAIQRVR
jgi:hypothetical protein